MNIDSFFSLIQTLIVLVLVIFLANRVLKYLNKYMTGKNKLIKVIERTAVNKNSYISVVDICGKYYLMSFSENSNEILKELDEEEIKDLLVGSEDVEGHKYYLEMRKKIGEKISIFKTDNNHSNDFDTTDGSS